MKTYTLRILILQMIFIIFLQACKKEHDAVSYSLYIDTRDNHTYNIVKIGDQTWMAENLAYVSDSGSWSYPDNSSATAVYGRLYDWKTACKVCPNGYHLPTDTEWKRLEIQIGLSQSDADKAGRRGTDEGNKLKSSNGWILDKNGTNEFGFSALPGGYRRPDGLIDNIGGNTFFWTSTEQDSISAWDRELEHYSDEVTRQIFQKDYGICVRCIRD